MDERSEVVRRALEYPYSIPSASYVLAGGRAVAPEEVDVELSERLPLLAYGSNATPEVLSQKLAASVDSVPVLRVTLRDFDVVYSAHVSRYGTVPATLLRSAATEVSTFLAYLTPDQLALLSPTEPNYLLATLIAPHCAVDGADPPERLRAYLSRHGCLRLDGSAVALEAIEARGRTFPARTEPEVLEHVRRLLGDRRELREFALACATDRDLRGRATEALGSTTPVV